MESIGREDLTEEMTVELRPKAQGGKRGSQMETFGRRVSGRGNNYRDCKERVRAGVFEDQKEGQYVRIQ